MKTIQSQSKEVEWLNTEVMHNASRKWLSELEFDKVEELFFDDLIKSYALHLIDSRHFNESRIIKDELNRLQKKTNVLIKSVQKHENELRISEGGTGQSKQDESYKTTHRQLIIDFSNFSNNYRVLKSALFDLIKKIIKEGKRKLLL